MLQRCAAAALLLAAALQLTAVGAAPLKKPTYRKDCFDQFVGELAAADQPGKGYGIIFYGDSIMESLRGTDKCRDACMEVTRRSSCKGVPEVLKKYFGKLKPGVMAVSMDQTANLLYRVQNGQIPKTNKPKVAVVLIGTNDMTNSAWSATIQSVKEKALAKDAGGIVYRIQETLKTMRTGMPDTHIVVLGELPRGTGTGKGLLNADNDFTWPSHYTKAISDINGQLRAYAANQNNMTFTDCGPLFLTSNGKKIDANMMADAIHPTAKGWDRLARCLNKVVKKLV